MKKFSIVSILLVFAFVLAACGDSSTRGMKQVAQKRVNENLTIAISTADGTLKNSEQAIGLKFTDGNGKPVEIKAASLNFHMPAMGSMAEMNDSAALNTTGTPGEFTGNVTLQMAGEWIAQIGYEGTETGKTTMKVTAR